MLAAVRLLRAPAGHALAPRYRVALHKTPRATCVLGMGRAVLRDVLGVWRQTKTTGREP